MLTSDALSASGIRHGFFTREGGISKGIYASLNCGFGSGDKEEKVTRNRTIVTETLGCEPESLCTAYQIHSAHAVVVGKPWDWQSAPEADALVTNTPGIALGILTADCLPILLADAEKRVIAAVHAGWKGAFTGVIEAAIATMCQLGARENAIAAATGPAIAQNSYEVGPEFRTRFIEQNIDNEKHFKNSGRAGHFLFDLKSYAEKRLRGAGIERINVLPHDTCNQENEFFSYRRSCLRNEPAYGRQVAVITL